MLVVEGNSSFKRMKRIDDNDSYQRAFNCELKLDNTDVEEVCLRKAELIPDPEDAGQTTKA